VRPHWRGDRLLSQGTSPLYVLSTIFGSNAPSEEGASAGADTNLIVADTIGAVSAIIWSLILVPSIKYALIALAMGTGTTVAEGGPFALVRGIACDLR